mmetsp:Transcript_906/g.903  ORF Transcript_906/g.903 Transcript_906/m.903 type:complete len:245 (-) Transcript_906:138-872(-)
MGEEILARSSFEVSQALDHFLKERKEASTAQDRAYKLYEAEMLHIVAEGEEEERVVVEREQSKSVDHNLMRLIHATGDEPTSSEDFDFGEDSQSANVSAPTSHSFTRSLISEEQTHILVKRNPPSETEKINLREQMFDFFDSTREAEAEMLNDLENKLGREDIRVSDYLDEVYELQAKNFGILMNFLDEYQPRPFEKAWGNDPDYIAISRKYGLKTKHKSDARNDLSTLKHSSRIRNAGSKSGR